MTSASQRRRELAALPAIDALERGVANVRANSELLIVQLVSSVLIAGSILVPLMLLLSRMGLPFSLLASNDPEAIRAAVEGMSFDPSSLLGLVGVGLAVALVGGALLFLFYCFIQGGTLAVLAAGDAQAPPARRLPLEVYRTFSWRAFFAWCGRFGWRLFWLVNLYLTVITLLLALLVLVLAVAVGALGAENVAASCAIACGLSVPFFFLVVVLWIGVQMSSAVLVVEDAGVGRSFRRGLALTGRRLGGLLLLLILLVAASVAISLVFTLVGFGLELGLSGPSVLRSAISGGLGVLQFLASTVISLVFAAAFVALARGESRADAAAAAGSVSA